MSMRQIQDPEDDSWIEAEIQRQLDEIEPLDNEEAYIQADGDLQDEDDVYDIDEEEEEEEDDEVPESVTAYLERVQSRSAGIMKEIEDCNIVLQQTKGITDASGDQPVSKAIEEIAFVLGEDPEDLYDTVMKEIELEEEKERQEDENGNGNDDTGSDTFLTAAVAGDNSTDTVNAVEDQNDPGAKSNMAVAVVTESMLAEREAREKLKQLVQKQREQDDRREREYRQQKEELEKQERRIDKMRQQKYQEYDREKVKLVEQRKVEEEQLEREMKEESKKMNEMLDEYKANIDEFAETTEKERQEFQHLMEQQRRERDKRITKAATTIQSTYRSYRVRKPYLPRLQKMRENRLRKIEMERQVEILEVRRKEENKKKAEKKKREVEDKRRKEEEERKLKEEQERRLKEEEEKRKQEEARKKEEERKRREEEERKQEEEKRKQKEEEERKRREEEERVKEEERRRKEAEEAERKRQEEERKRREEERKKEEQKRKDEELRVKKQTEEKRAKEERLVEQLEKERLQDKEKDDIEKKAEDILTKIHKQIASNKTSFQNEQDKVPGHNDSRTKMREKSEASLEHNKQEKVDNDKRNISNSAVRGENSVNSVEKSDNVLQERTSKPCAITNEVTTDDNNKSCITEMLPESLEKRRLQWMEQCIPWGKVIGETKGQARRSAKSRIGKRPASAKQLPDLSDYLLRQASPENTTLKQVKTVQVQGLSGCSMCSLKQCPSVRSISLVQCGIVAVEGISDCKLLQHLNLQHNKVESLNCQDLQRLQELLMSSNSLTSVHGLDGCVDVRVADFSNNRITRTGGFESCHKLTRLLLDHNQLINTRGLHNSPSIQVLDLSHNHLSSVQDLDKCCLLKTLNLTGNSLQEPPQLRNHVLLRQLFLDDNSLSSLEVLSKAWLPLLEHLSVSQNSLSEVTSLANLLLLKSLDVSHNCIADVNSLLTGIEECHRLQHMSIQGNPLTEESQYRSSILAKLPWLQKLDSEDVTPSVSHDQSRPMSSFEVMCISQIQRQNDMQARHRKQLQETRERYPGYTDTLLDLKSRQFDEVHDLAIQHRYMHEYGDLTEDTGILDDGKTTDVTLGNSDGGALSQTAGKKSVTFRDSAGNKASVSVPANVVGKALMTDDDEHFHRAAVKIQSLWRGYSVRQEISEHTQRWLAATIIQACWRGHSVRQQIRHYIPEFYARREPALHRQPYPPAQTITSPQMQPCPPPHNAMPSHRRGNQRDFIFRNDTSGPHSDMINGNIAISPLENMAAIKIQALWRGYIIRKRIREFKDAVKFDDGEEEDFFGEFDLSNFEFNEASLEQGWSPAETPQIPVSHPILPPTPPVQPQPPRQAWRGASSPMVNDRSQPTPLGKPPLPPGSSMSTETPRTHASSKQEKISEEWGFKDSTTAELMLKRAKKMHRKKKIIDPKKKFELFKKLQESTKLNSVQPPARKQSNKQDYFHARQQMQNFMDMQSRSATEQKQQMVFEWVHTQAGPYSGADTPQPNKRPPATNLGRHTHSDSSLPHIDPQVLEGGRVQLVASPSIELESVGDTSTVASSPDKRRHSFSSPNDERVQFPPLKTNSAPSSHTRERMAATEQFAGWGGGRRRNKYK